MTKLMNRALIAAVTLTMISTIGTDARAGGGSPHFVGDLKAHCSGENLLVSFKVGGVGEGQFIDIAADGDATVQCINRGDNDPPGQESDVQGGGTFGPSSKNGNITGAVLVTTPDTCPDKMTKRVTFENIVLILEGGLDFAVLEGTFVCD